MLWRQGYLPLRQWGVPETTKPGGLRPPRTRSVHTVRPTRHRPPDPVVGQELTLDVGPIAHGGHCVARYEGRVVFVRHALPGEQVRAVVTEGGKFWRADALEVLANPSPDRVPAVWPAAGPGGVGGAELSHVSLEGQRRWKAAVVAEQLQRLAGIERMVEVESAPGDEARGGMEYRTRIDLVVGRDGRVGMRKHRSHDVVPLAEMPLATAAVASLAEAEGVFTCTWEPGSRLELVAPACDSAPLLLIDGEVWRGGRVDRRENVRRSVAEEVQPVGSNKIYAYRVSGDGFWQNHREAPAVLTGTVVAALSDLLGGMTGASVLDLYAGAGLFTLPLADLVGESGCVFSIEGNPRAVRDARRNAHHLPQVTLLQGGVEEVLASPGDTLPDAVDAVVLDPPRTGAGRAVCDAIAALCPKRVVYVACDPAALARDVGYLAGHGYRLAGLRAFDLFPHTHHVECVTVLDRD